MTHFIHRALALACCAAALAGCTSVTTTTPDIHGRTVTVARELSGRQVDLGPDQDLEVRLPSVPSDGRRWVPESPNEGAVLARLGPPVFERASRDVNPFEGAGFDVFRFHPKAAGQQTLRFEYRREGMLEPAPVEAVWFLVTVR